MVAIYHWVIDGDAPFNAITEVLDYLWDAELTDYENGSPYGHVFENLARIANWLNSGAVWSPRDYVDARRAGLPSSWRVSASYEKPDGRPDPARGDLLPMRSLFETGETLDVSEQAKAAGFTCPVEVTAGIWKHVIERERILGCRSEEECLGNLLRHVADAFAKEGRDVSTWLYVDGWDGPLLTTIRAVHRREAGRIAGLTIMLSCEEGV